MTMNTTRESVVMGMIRSYIPKEEIEFVRNEITGELELLFPKRHALMTIKATNSWREIKRHIDAKISEKKSSECPICSSEKIQQRRVSCTKCAEASCVDCFINIFRANKGITKCPFCRYEVGFEISDSMVELGVQQIVAKFSSGSM
jgi:hypothetical protein